jgi:hypothetical protein
MLLHRYSVDHEKDNTATMENEIGNITSAFIKVLEMELNAYSDLLKTGI